MAISTNKSTKAFTDAIRRIASEQCRQTDAQTKLLRSQGLADMKKEIRHQYDVYIERELSKIRNDVNRQSARCSEQSKRELSELRSQMSAKVFENVRGRIDEFIKTPEYTQLLLGSIKNIEAQAGTDSLEFRLCPRDMSLKEELEKALGWEITVCADEDIKVGGVRAYCESTDTLLDDTLDMRLEAQKKWFLENSGLKV